MTKPTKPTKQTDRGSEESFASLLKKKSGPGRQVETFASLLKGQKERAPISAPAAPPPPPEPAAPEPEAAEPSAPVRELPALPELAVAVFETGPSNQKRAVDVIDKLGYTALDTRRDSGKLRRMLSARKPPDVAIIGLPGGEAEIDRVKEREPRPLIVATVPGPAESARERALAAGADLFLVRPHAKDNLSMVLAACAELARTRTALAEASEAERDLRDRLSRFGEPDKATGFQHFEFFQRLLVMELKRARRYGYSLAAALVEIDALDSELGPVDARRLRERVATAITSNIRDIDIPVEHVDGRVLLFLPYTDLEGATEVGNRIVKAVRKLGRLETGDGELRATISVGISALRSGQPISFARLMKDANQALRAAALKGGNRVVVRQ